MRYEHKSVHIATGRLPIIKDYHCKCAHSYLNMIMSWNDDVSYALSLYKLFILPIGGWPLQEYNTIALVRFLISWSSLVRFQLMFYTMFQFYFYLQRK